MFLKFCLQCLLVLLKIIVEFFFIDEIKSFKKRVMFLYISKKLIDFICGNLLQPGFYRNAIIRKAIDVGKSLKKSVGCNICTFIKVPGPAKDITENRFIV